MAVDAARAKSLFLAASDLSDPAERAAYLDRECGDDDELRGRVEATPTGQRCLAITTSRHRRCDRRLPTRGNRCTEPRACRRRNPISIRRWARSRPIMTPQPNRTCSSPADTRSKKKSAKGAWARSGSPSRSEPVKRKVALEADQDRHGFASRAPALRAGTPGAGDDGPPQHRQGPRRRPDADRSAVLRDGAGQRPAAEQVLRRDEAHAQRAAGTLRADLPGRAARPSEGHRPSRPKAGQYPGHA